MDVFVLSQMFEPNSVVGVPIAYIRADSIEQAIKQYTQEFKSRFPGDKITVEHDAWNSVRAEITTGNEADFFMFAIFKVESWERL